jgi:hypothetical protein
MAMLRLVAQIQVLVIWRLSTLVTVMFGALALAVALGLWPILRMAYSLALTLEITLATRQSPTALSLRLLRGSLVIGQSVEAMLRLAHYRRSIMAHAQVAIIQCTKKVLLFSVLAAIIATELWAHSMRA